HETVTLKKLIVLIKLSENSALPEIHTVLPILRKYSSPTEKNTTVAIFAIIIF
ncbi:16537_t:CDS:1, partial [Dentiscutata erythropus]